MLGQSLLQVAPLPHDDTPPFLWIIKIDPNLDAFIRDELVNLVKSYPFIILVGSNLNYGVGIRVGGWRGGEAASDVFASDIYSGSADLFRRAYNAREHRAVLVTRLDADDGLHVEYLASIQEQAISKLSWEFYRQRSRHRKRANKWIYWCPQVQVEWHSMPGNATPYGLFFGQQLERSCGTAGLAVGVSIGVNESSIPPRKVATKHVYTGGFTAQQPEAKGNGLFASYSKLLASHLKGVSFSQVSCKVQVLL
jgi:hypothetical protein